MATMGVIRARLAALDVSDVTVKGIADDRLRIDLADPTARDVIARVATAPGNLEFVAVPDAFANAIVDGGPLPSGMVAEPLFGSEGVAAARVGTTHRTRSAWISTSIRPPRRHSMHMSSIIKVSASPSCSTATSSRRRPSTRGGSTGTPRSVAASMPTVPASWWRCWSVACCRWPRRSPGVSGEPCVPRRECPTERLAQWLHRRLTHTQSDQANARRRPVASLADRPARRARWSTERHDPPVDPSTSAGSPGPWVQPARSCGQPEQWLLSAT